MPLLLMASAPARFPIDRPSSPSRVASETASRRIASRTSTGMVGWGARSKVAPAEVLLSEGSGEDRGRAAMMLEDGSSVARGTGMLPLLEEAARVRRRFDSLPTRLDVISLPAEDRCLVTTRRERTAALERAEMPDRRCAGALGDRKRSLTEQRSDPLRSYTAPRDVTSHRAIVAGLPEVVRGATTGPWRSPAGP
jgi:hypothetical protein